MNAETLVVVHQMGKVASTAIVETLSRIEGVRAVQSHFLGTAALEDMVHIMTDPDTTEYFYRHQIGQYVLNIQTTREIAVRRKRADAGRLVMLSLARDPLEWFRSSLVQDIGGYATDLCHLAGPSARGDDGEAIAAGLAAFLASAIDIAERMGGIDPLQAALQANEATVSQALAGWPPGQVRMLYMMLRPFDWFEKHYRPVAGHGLEEMTRVEGVWEHRIGRSQHFVIRYEDLHDAYATFLRRSGIGGDGALVFSNKSGGKPHAARVKAAFAGDEARRLGALFGESRYARQFSYCAARDGTVSADHGREARAQDRAPARTPRAEEEPGVF